MNDIRTSLFDSLSPLQRDRIDQVCLRFENARKEGGSPRVDDYLQDVGEAERPALLRELLFLDWQYRQKQTSQAEFRSSSNPAEGMGTVDFTGGDPSSTLLPESAPKKPMEPSDEVPGYEILELLGRGGMGVVFRARQTKLKRLVALKMILAGPHAAPEQLARFKTEAEAVAHLHHPNIVQIYEVGEHQGLPWFSLEYVEGGTLADHLAGNPQPARPAAQLVETLARATHYAHIQGIVHRDLKPANILLQESGMRNQESGVRNRKSGKRQADADSCLLTPESSIPKITDFGLAKNVGQESGQTQSGTILGTPSYMAPEQAGDSHAVGPATDVYALGAILYEMLTGRPPFKAASLMDTVYLVLTEDPVPPRRLQPKVPRDLEIICLKCLHKDPRGRYPSGEALAEDLRRFVAGEAILARPASVMERVVKWARRRPALAGLLAVSTLAILALLVVWYLFTLKVQEQRDRAEANFQRALQAVNHMLVTASDKTFQYEPRLQEKRQEMLKTALELFEGFLVEKSNDPEVRKKAAQAHQKVADLYRLLQQPLKAEQAYQQAIALLTQLPDEPEIRHARAECYNWLGEVLRSTSQLQAAQDAYGEARRLQENLVQEFPADLNYLKDLARSFYNNGIVFKDSALPRKAEIEFRQGISLLEDQKKKENLSLTPEILQELALCYLNLGTVLDGPRQVEAADASTQAITILARLAEAQPEVPDYRFDLAVAHNNRGNCWARIHKLSTKPELLGKAEHDHRQAIKLLDKLSKDYPRYPKYGHELANTLNSLGALLVSVKNMDGAGQAWNQATTILEKLVSDYPNLPDFEGDLGMTLGNLGWLLGRQEKWPEARSHLLKAIPHVQAALKPNPKHPDYRQALRNQYRDLAKTLVNLKDHAGAARAAADLLQASRQTKDDFYLAAYYLVQCMTLVETAPKMSDDQRKQVGLAYGEEAIKLLIQAKKLGLADLDGILAQSMFQPLRRHPSFRKLRKE